MKHKKLLTIGGNPKTIKSDLSSEYLTAILHLAPYTLSGVNVCPKASKGCAASCLNSAGRGRFASIQKARLEKTRHFIDNRSQFIIDLIYDIKAFVRKCERLGKKPAVRLNGTSDLPWERMGIMEQFPDVQFYDYTAIALRFDATWKKPSNYHLTFSMKEDNDADAVKVLNNGGNIAVVFRSKIPDTFMGKPVIDGTLTDLRFKDTSGVVVGLLAKGKAKVDSTGFVRDIA
jgi:hypothetical protein